MTWIAFGELNFNGILTTALTVPAVNFVIMPAGLAVMLLVAPGLPVLGIAPPLAHAAAWTAAALDTALRIWVEVMPSMRYVD